MADPVSNPLTLILPIKSEKDYQELKDLLEGFGKKPPGENPIRVALTKLGLVHFARFAFLGKTHLGIITTYDGDFDRYLDAFINAIGGVFDKLFVHIKDAPPLPVSEHRKHFLDFIKKYDVPCIKPFFSAYPDLTALDILTLQKEDKERKAKGGS